METQWTRMTANEAAEIIQHNDMVAFSGFTPAGSPKALPTAIARRANEQHEAKKPYQIRLLTGASISAASIPCPALRAVFRESIETIPTKRLPRSMT